MVWQQLHPIDHVFTHMWLDVSLRVDSEVMLIQCNADFGADLTR